MGSAALLITVGEGRDADSTFCEEVFDVPEAPAESVVEPDCVRDDLGRVAVAAIAGGCDGVHWQSLPVTAVNLTVPDGVLGPGHATQLTQSSGSYWFFDRDNVELDIKVLDGCGVNGHYWVFVAGLTNVQVQIRVTDTDTGHVWSNFNRLGKAFEAVQVTTAFVCP